MDSKYLSSAHNTADNLRYLVSVFDAFVFFSGCTHWSSYRNGCISMYGIEQVLGEAHTNSHSSLNTWNSSSQPTFTFAKEVFVFLVFLLGISIASGIYRVTDKSTFDLWVKLILWTWQILWIKITWRIKSTLSWIKLTLLEISSSIGKNVLFIR